MNTDTGMFVDESEAKEHMERLSVGEVVKIKGVEFEVQSIGEREVKLKLMSAHDRTMQELFDEPRNRHERRRQDALDRRNRIKW